MSHPDDPFTYSEVLSGIVEKPRACRRVSNNSHYWFLAHWSPTSQFSLNAYQFPIHAMAYSEMTIFPGTETRECVDVLVRWCMESCALCWVKLRKFQSHNWIFMSLLKQVSMDSFSQFSIATPFQPLTNQGLNFSDDSFTALLHSSDIFFDGVDYNGHFPTGSSTVTPLLHPFNSYESVSSTDRSSHRSSCVIGGVNLGPEVCLNAHGS